MDKVKMPIRAAPFTHQREAFEEALRQFGLTDGIIRSRGYGLLFQMGLGKSLTAIAVAGELYLQGKIKRALVTAPLSVLGVWDEECDKFADFDYSLTILTGSGAKKAEALKNIGGKNLQVVVINYESAWRMEKEIAAWRPDLIIADEGHKLKVHSTKVSKAMHRLGAAADYRLLLTGTLVTNKAIDIFSPYKFLNPAIFGNSFYSFRNQYFDMCGYGSYTPVLKKSMEPELTRKLHSIAYRATKAECLDLPEMTDIVRYVELEPAAMRVYRELVKENYAELERGEITTSNILTKILRLSQLTGGFLNNDGGVSQRISTAKMVALEDIVDGAAAEDKKLVIVAHFVPEVKAICTMLEKRGIRYSCIYGEVKDRAEQVAAFQTDPDVKIMVGQITTIGLGLTLTAASTLIFYSENYSMSDFEQTKSRIHRNGQREPCTFIYLTASGTVDERVLKSLRDKADLAKALIDDYRKGVNPFN